MASAKVGRGFVGPGGGKVGPLTGPDFMLYAALFKSGIPGTPFTLDAYKTYGYGGDFTVDAVFAPYFTTDAVIFKTQSVSFTVDAIAGQTTSGSVTLDAIIKKTVGGWITAVHSVDQPLIWYRMGEPSGSFLDSGSTGQHASTFSGTPTREVAGAVDTGASFNGAQRAWTASYALALGNVFTMEAWIYPTSTGRRTIWSGTNTASMFQLEIDGNGTDRVSAIINGTFVAETVNNAIVRNQWSHVVYRRTGTGAGTHSFFVNGVQKTLLVDGANNYANTASNKVIGSRSTAGSQQFTGTIDEVIAWARALSDAEILQHYRQSTLFATLDAWLATPSVGGSFTVDAVIQALTFQVDAVVLSSTSLALDADAVIQATMPGSYPVAAWLAGVFTLDAYIANRVVSSFTADAMLSRGHFTLDSTIEHPQAGSFSLAAVVLRTHQAGTDTATIFDTGLVRNAMLSNTNYSQLLLGNYLGFGHNQTTGYAGQDLVTGSYRSYQSFHRFEKYQLRTGEAIVAARLAIGGGSDNSTTDFDIEAYHYEYDPSDMFASFRPQAWLQSATLLGKLNTSSYVTTDNVYMDLSDEGTLAAAINSDSDGRTSIVFASSRFRSGTAPSGPEYASIDSTVFASQEEPRITLTIAGDLPAMTLDAVIAQGYFHLDAVIGRYFTVDAAITGIHSFALDAIRQRTQTSGLTANAVIRRTQSAGKTADAVLRRTISASLTVDAYIAGPVKIDAVLHRQQRGVFVLEAYFARNTFVLDAAIQPGGSTTLRAVLRSTLSRTFSLDAFIFDGTTRVRSRTLDATLRRTATASRTLNAVIAYLVTQGTGSAPIDALQLAPAEPVAFTLDASLHSGTWSGSMTVDADIRGGNEQRSTLALAAILGRQTRGLVVLEAWLERREVFHLDALIAGHIFVNAVLRQPLTFSLNAILTSASTIDAVIKRTQSPTLTANAVIASATGGFPGHEGSFSANALIIGSGSGTPIWVDAIIVLPATPQAFSLDAFLGTQFVVSAWLARTDGGLYGGVFGVAAYIHGNTTIIWPDDGGPATDPDGNPLPDWFKTSRKYRISILVGGTEVTGDVIWSQTTFTQNAKTNPGTFDLVLKGVFGFDGGEEIIVTIDDFRVFGGYVLSVERSYAFSADAEDPITTLRGADFNVLFDKLIVYNKASVPDASGRYTTYKSFKKGSLDTKIINKVFSSYVDLPPGFDYTTYVESVDTAAPEKPWTMPESGSPLRQVMQSISQVTEAVWWIDPYLNLHYGSRTTVTAPFPITDGLGGISSQQLSMSTDISQLVTETLVWGTLSYDVDGDIRVKRRTSSAYATLGPWQSAEFRSDLHHTAYIERRAESIIDRYGEPIKRAKVIIFEPGYQAGQVADVRLTEHGLQGVLVIRSMTLTIAVAKEPAGGFYYAVPRYELQVGLDPEEPWDIYDYLPFPGWRDAWPPRWKRDRDREQDCEENSGGGGGACICGAGAGDTFTRVVTSGGWGTADSGVVWGSGYNPGADPSTLFVDGQTGVYDWTGTTLGYWPVLPGPFIAPFEFKIDMLFPPEPQAFSAEMEFNFGSGATDPVFYFTLVGNPTHLMFGEWWADGITEDNWNDPIWADSIAPFDVSRWVTVRVAVTATNMKAKAWYRDEPEPVVWHIDTDLRPSYEGYPDPDLSGSFDEISIIGFLHYPPGSGDGPYHFDNLNLEGCAGNRFDDFERTVASGWGISDYGTVWQFWGAGGWSSSVDGSSGKWVGGPLSGALGQNHRSADWDRPDTFSMHVRFRWDNGGGTPSIIWSYGIGVDAEPASQTPSAGISIFQVDALGVFVFQVYEGNGDELDELDDIPYTLTQNVSYEARWERTATLSRARIWVSGTIEPSTWDVTVNRVIGAPAHVKSYVQSFQTGYTRTVYTDFIDFDYDGKPCPGCGGSPYWKDDFDNRHTSPAVADWGQAAMSTAPYLTDANGTNAWAYIYRLISGDGTGYLEAQDQGVASVSLSSSDAGGAFTSAFTMLIDVQLDTFPIPTGSDYHSLRVDWSSVPDGGGASEFFARFEARVTTSATWGRLFFDISDSRPGGTGYGANVPFTDWDDDAFYWLEWTQYAVGFEVRWWKQGTSRPSAPTFFDYVTPASTTSDAVFQLANGSGTEWIAWNFRSITFNTACAETPGGGGGCDDPEGETFGAITEGWGCETIYVRNSKFSTTGLVTTGTMRVYDADSGRYLNQDDDWHDGDRNGKDFVVDKAGVERVIACYRNYVVNIGNRPSVPRNVTPSVSILGERHIPI